MTGVIIAFSIAFLISILFKNGSTESAFFSEKFYGLFTG
jgi:hypothetical protein